MHSLLHLGMIPMGWLMIVISSTPGLRHQSANEQSQEWSGGCGCCKARCCRVALSNMWRSVWPSKDVSPNHHCSLWLTAKPVVLEDVERTGFHCWIYQFWSVSTPPLLVYWPVNCYLFLTLDTAGRHNKASGHGRSGGSAWATSMYCRYYIPLPAVKENVKLATNG